MLLLLLALLSAGVSVWLGSRGGPGVGTDEVRSAEEARGVSPKVAGTGAAVEADEARKAKEPWRSAPVRAGVDASNLYKDAFVLFDRLTEEEKAMIRKPREEVDAEQAAQLFEKAKAILELLHRAAQADYCDWGQAPYTFETPMPQITKAVDLGKLGLWAAAYQLPSDPAAALAVLGDRAKLGSHLADTLLGLVVQNSFERSAHDLLVQNVAGMDGAHARVMELLRGSALDENVARAFEGEVSGVEEIGKRLAAAGPETAAMLASSSEGGNEEERRSLAAMLTSFSENPLRLAAEIGFIHEMEREAAKALLLPEAEYQEWRREKEAQLLGHPMAMLVLPSLLKVQEGLQKTRVERTMLSAGLAVLMGGPAQLGSFRDPATQRELTYMPTPTGFELRSGYAVKGKPVTMAFPKSQSVAR